MSLFWEHFTEIITDPAHTAVEFTFVLLDYLVIQTIAHRLKKHFHRDLAKEHTRLDAEHGISHRAPGPEALAHPDLVVDATAKGVDRG